MKRLIPYASASALALMVPARGAARPLDPVNTTHYQLNVETVAEGLRLTPGED